MDKKEILKFVREKGYFICPDALEYVSKKEDPFSFLNKVMEKLSENKLFIELKDVEIVDVENKKIVINGKREDVFAKDIESEVEILENFSEESTGTVEEFVQFFVNRFEFFRDFMKFRIRPDIKYYNVSALKGMSEIEAKTIGLVYDKYETKNGHIIIELEDPTGIINVLIPKDNEELKKLAVSIVHDEAITVIGYKTKGDIFIAKEIYFPDVEMKKPKKIPIEIYSVFLSDIHIGSKLFLKDDFEKFISWINGKYGDEKLRSIAKKVKYLFIAGDIVDGVGIYPGQEEELEILDIFKQYEYFEKYLMEIPEYIEIILIPGNHDFSRSPDPQQPLAKELFPNTKDYRNIHFLASPSMIKTHGFKVLMYHGTFFDNIIANIPYLNYEDIGKVMEEILKKRHVHVIYGGKSIIPYKYDPMIIREEPDIFHTGHVHKNGYSLYKGIYCINSGTFQSITPYQEKQGHKPTPSIVPILNMKNGKITEISFRSGF